MAQTSALVGIIKKQLRLQGKTYLDVADALFLSEPSIKRMFAEEHFTLKRIDKICQLLSMDLSDIVSLMQEQQEHISQLTIEQEKRLVSDPKLLLIAVSVYNRQGYDEILSTYNFDEKEFRGYLRKLESTKFLSLNANNRIKLEISRKFNWIANGPIQQFFNEKVQQEFFASNFDAPGEKMQVITGMLSQSSNQTIQKKMERLINDFRDYDNEDSQLPLEKRFGTTMVLALRPWELKEFTAMRVDDKEKSFPSESQKKK